MQKYRKILYCFAVLAGLVFLLGGCAAQETSPVQKSTVAMGSVVTVKLYGATQTDSEALAGEVLNAIADLDTQVISKNAGTSELARLNASENPEILTKVSAELFSALQDTQEIYSRSDGKAALASGALTEIWGLDTEDFRVPSASEIEAAKPLCTDETVLFTDDGCVAFQKGQILNLGSVGKGLACDKAVQVIAESGLLPENGGALVSVGGSLALVGSPKDGAPFTIGVRDPFGTENEYFATLSLTDGFVSTSGSYEKKFQQGGKTYHHLLDLTTGYPAETDLCAVTVTAKTGLQSDALSTLCFLLGEEKALPILEAYGAEAIFVYTDKTVHVTSGLSSALQITDSTFQAEAV
ncbi:MAG: FAD:protein FMN transferase [Candidatus Fimenecus sp.]